MINSRLARGVLYSVFTVLSVVFVYTQMYLSKYAATSFHGYPVLIFGVLLNVILGFLLGLEYLLIEARKDSHRWALNWPKLLLIGLPALMFILANYFYAHGIHIPAVFLDTHVTQLYCLVLGFAIATGVTPGRS